MVQICLEIGEGKELLWGSYCESFLFWNSLMAPWGKEVKLEETLAQVLSNLTNFKPEFLKSEF